MEILKFEWNCPLCDYKFMFLKIPGELITAEYFIKAALHFLHHSDSLFIGSHDFLWWWKDCIPSESMDYVEFLEYDCGGNKWKRQCYGAFHELKRVGYLKSYKNYKNDNSITEEKLSRYNQDLEKIHWRYYKKTEKYFNEFKNEIKNDYKISTYKMTGPQKSFYFKKKQQKQKVIKKPTIDFLKRYKNCYKR